MSNAIAGIHHITAICSDAQRNLDFYSGFLGLRLVKRTVNFDDPGAYHLYYGDGIGHPGTVLTFFAWPGAARGRIGYSQVTHTSFAIPTGSVRYWTTRLAEHGILFQDGELRFGERVLAFSDPDGMTIELIETSTAKRDRSYAESFVASEHAVCGFHSATLAELDHRNTTSLLGELFGLKFFEQEGNRFRYVVETPAPGQLSDPGTIVDVLLSRESSRGNISVGSVHHIAWRTPNDEQQSDWLKTLSGARYHPSPIKDRLYFHSIYFREPGGILFEIATDTPGFTFDESADELGLKTALPPWLEPSRAKLERALPPLNVPVKA